MKKALTNIDWVRPIYRDKVRKSRTTSIVALLYSLMGISVVCTPLFYAYQYDAGAILMIYILVVCALHILLLKYCDHQKLVSFHFGTQMIVSTALLVIVSGGIGSPYCISLFAIGPPAYVVLSNDRAHRWVAVTTLIFLAIAVYQLLGYEMPYSIPSRLSSYVWLIVFIGNSIMLVQVIIGYRRQTHKYKKRIQESNTQLSQSNVELERFAHIASHDLSSPLLSIINFGNVLDTKYRDKLDSSSQQYLDIVRKSAEEMENLVSDILTFSQTRNHKPNHVTVNLQSIVDDIADQLRSTGLYPHMKVISNDLPEIKSDPTLIRQLFQNVIENGLKYNDSTSPTVWVDHQSEKEIIQIIVKDNGIGIDAEYYTKVFEMFQRLHNKSEYQGTGIGLAICKKIVETLGGSIDLESEVGKGSTFVISLPTSIQQKKSPDFWARALDY